MQASHKSREAGREVRRPNKSCRQAGVYAVHGSDLLGCLPTFPDGFPVHFACKKLAGKVPNGDHVTAALAHSTAHDSRVP